MAILLSLGQEEQRFALSAHALVGRSSACTLRINEPRASAEHARIAYRDGHWTIRDLGSRNGTFVNGEKLEPSMTRTLARGDKIAFGNLQQQFTLEDASAPAVMARRLSTGEYLAPSRDEMLVLPSPAQPEACIFEDAPSVWLLEIEGTSREARDNEILSIGGESFVVYLPVPMVPTIESTEAKPKLGPIELRFRVSANEEVVEVTVVAADEIHVLAPRTHHYTLLTLARSKVRDKENKALSASQQGWVFVDELCRMLSVDEFRLNTEIYRIRQDISAAGVPNAAGIIERRRGSRQLRLATERVHIEQMQ